MGTEIEKIKKLAAKYGLKISKKKKPKGTPDSHYFIVGVFGKVAERMIKQKDLTIRKIMMRTIEDKDFDVALDYYFKGPKRAAFDDKTEKKYNTAKTLVQDLYLNGQFKRYKLLERALTSKGHPRFSVQMLKVLYKSYHRPAGDKVTIKKRKYKK
jgi:hypothetical protein|tara:strand:- start:128 stop:592 length:465 start_codon:yes stop_codon:yes gene_type:complete